MPSAESQFFMELRHVGGVGLFILVLVLKNNRFLFGLLCQAAKTRRLVAINRSEIKLSPATTMTSFQNVQNITVSNGVQRSPTPLNHSFHRVRKSRRFSKILEVLVWIAMIRFFGSWLFPSACLTCSHMFLFPTWCSTHLWQQSPTPASGIENVHLEAIGFLCLGCVVEHSEPLLIHFSHFIRIESGRASNILRTVDQNASTTPFCQNRKFHYASLQSRDTIGVRQGEKSKAIQ